MKHKGLLASGLVALLAILMVTAVSAAGNANLAGVRMATAQFHRTEVAEASGYNLLPELDHCFNNPGVGAMGYHYIDAGPGSGPAPSRGDGLCSRSGWAAHAGRGRIYRTCGRVGCSRKY